MGKTEEKVHDNNSTGHSQYTACLKRQGKEEKPSKISFLHCNWNCSWQSFLIGCPFCEMLAYHSTYTLPHSSCSWLSRGATWPAAALLYEEVPSCIWCPWEWIHQQQKGHTQQMEHCHRRKNPQHIEKGQLTQAKSDKQWQEHILKLPLISYWHGIPGRTESLASSVSLEPTIVHCILLLYLFTYIGQDKPILQIRKTHYFQSNLETNMLGNAVQHHYLLVEKGCA